MRMAQYTIRDVVYTDDYTVLARAFDPDGNASLIKYQDTDYPVLDLDARWKHEFQLLRSINSDFIIKAVSLVPLHSGHILEFESFSGLSLETLLKDNKFSLYQRLQVAHQLALAIGEVHREGLILRGITPKHILIKPSTLELKLCDLGLASKLDREPRYRSSSLWRSLEYISPELTGRTNLDVDYRSDFYTLGIILYELFAGQRPFVSEDPMTLLHSHIARLPQPLDEFDRQVPAQLSLIVLKLLAKSPIDRYQSSYGLQDDLRQCIEQWQSQASISSFPLAQKDIPERFCIAPKLYGREAELDALQSAFTKASAGEAQVVMISGYSGIGKTELANELHKPVVAKRGLFVSGKCDQYNRNQPYAALIQAFQSLIPQLLSEGKERQAYWKQTLQSALGASAGVLDGIIPDLRLLLGDMPVLEALPSADNEKRFHLTFSRFVKALSSNGHPLVMFLDDLQWADLPTLKLIEQQCLHQRDASILMVGAYRDNEVQEGDALQASFQAIKQGGGSLRILRLDALPLQSVNMLIADTLACPESLTSTLAQLCYEKTQGNPFFLKQFLQSLYQHGDIQYQHDSGGWSWNIAHIRERNITDNVVEFMLSKMHTLNPETRHVLSLTSLLGNRFDLQKLAIVYEHNIVETARVLWPALLAELILPLDENYKFDQSPEKLALTRYKFLHDRVQQAAYSLIDEHERPSLLLKTGRLLWANVSDAELDGMLFELLDTLNSARALITDSDEQKRLLALNLRGGIKAKAASAYAASVRLLRVAKELLENDAWQRAPDQTLAVYRELAEAEYLAGHFEEADALYLEASVLPIEPFAKVTLMLVQSSQYLLQGRFSEALPVLLSGLSLLGSKFPATEELAEQELSEIYGYTRKILSLRSECSLLDAIEMESPEQLLQMEIHSELTIVFYQLGRFNAYAVNSCKMLMLSLDAGLCDLSPLAYLTYAWALSRMGDKYSSCYAIARLAMKLVNSRESKYHRVLIYQGFGAFMQHWCEPIQNTFGPLAEAAELGYQGLNLTSAGHAVLLGVVNKFIKGVGLEELEIDIQQGLDFLRRTHQQSTVNFLLLGGLQPVLALQGKTPDPLSFDTPQFKTSDVCDVSSSDSSMELALYSQAMLRHSFILGNSAELKRYVSQLWLVEACLPDSPSLTDSYFYAALSLLRLAKPESASFEIDMEIAKQYAEKFKLWAADCTENFSHKHLLIEAELKRIEGTTDEAIACYDAAIAAAENANFIQCVAIANESYALFWIEHGQARIAQSFIKEAHYVYQRWGAEAKCAALEDAWPEITFRTRARRTATYDKALTVTAKKSRAMDESGLLDLHSLLKANQLLSEEIHLTSLLKKIMAILMENAGAQKGAMILSEKGVIESDGQLMVEVFGTLEPGRSDVDCQLLGKPLADACSGEDPLLPESLVRFVQQSQDTLLLNNPVMEPRFSANLYLQQREPKSVLCMPVVGQGKLVAIVYLENDLTEQAFTLQHKETLEILSAQAAVSLVNARLYEMVLASLGTADKINTLKSEALDAAESANRLKDSFMSTITHELLTPINGIRLSLSLMKSGVNKECEEFLKTAEDSSEHLLNLVESIFTFVEARRGSIRLKQKPFSLYRLLKGVFNHFNSIKESEDLNLRLEWDVNTPEWIVGDENKLSTIIVQLLKNACAFTKQGEVVLSCSSKECKDGSKLLELAVKDTGVGIRDDVKSKIFEAFNQADNSINRMHGGMGIGLTIVNEILKLMGGTLELDSAPDKGSVFTLSIPVEQSAAPEKTQNVTAKERLGSHSKDTFENAKILVVEDNPVNMKLLCKVLEKADYQPLSAKHGEEALSVLQENPDIAAILMDCQMPIMDGYEATRQIRLLESFKLLPIIAVTANVSEEDQQRCRDAGMSDYMAKPVKKAAVEATLIKWLRETQNRI